MTDPLDAFPETFASGDISKPVVYRRLRDYYAIHGPAAGIPGAEFNFEDESIAVFRGAPANARVAEGATTAAVYATQDGNLPCVPTGRVLIRYAEGDRAVDHRAEIAKAGMQLDEVLSYAPHAAWLSAKTGAAAGALDAISRLRRLPGVAFVEAQLLRQRAAR